jgi:hypothetical protein
MSDPTWHYASLTSAQGANIRVSFQVKDDTDGESASFSASPAFVDVWQPGIHAGSNVSLDLKNISPAGEWNPGPSSLTDETATLKTEEGHAWGEIPDMPIGFMNTDGEHGDDQQQLAVTIGGQSQTDPVNGSTTFNADLMKDAKGSFGIQ